MELVKRIAKKQIIIAKCEKCGRHFDIPYTNTIKPHMPSIDLKDVIHCECGEYHNLIIDKKRHKPITSAATVSNNNSDNTLRCPRCQSTQLHAGDKGFSLGKAVIGRILFGTVGLLGGFVGHKKIMITCLKCGYKWQAGKR